MSKACKVMIMGTLITVSIAGGSLAIRETQVEHTMTQEEEIFNYRNEPSLAYKVHLTSTELYDEEILGENLYYMNDYIAGIALDFQDNYEGSEVVDIEGNYTITSELRGYTVEYEGQDEVKHTVWSKKKVEVDNKSFNKTDSKYQIGEQLNIDIQPYNQFVRKLIEEKQYAIPTELIVEMSGNKIIHTPKGEIELPIKSNVSIPINQTYFSIQKEMEEPKEEIQTEMVTTVIPFNESYVIGCTIVSLLAIAGCVFVGIKGENYSQKEKHSRKIKRIFNEHGSRMVGVDMLNTDKFVNTYTLAQIDDLVKLADELEKPIMYIKATDENEINRFYVAEQDNLYMFIVEPPSEEEATVLTKEEKKAQRLQQKEQKKLQKAEAKALKQQKRAEAKLAKQNKKSVTEEEMAATVEVGDEVLTESEATSKETKTTIEQHTDNMPFEHGQEMDTVEDVNHFKSYYKDKE